MPVGPDEPTRPESRSLPASEQDPQLVVLVRLWPRKSRVLKAAIGAFAAAEHLSFENACRRLIWYAVQVIDGHERTRRQTVRLHRQWLVDQRGRKRLIVPELEFDDAQWERWWHKEVWRWAALFVADLIASPPEHEALRTDGSLPDPQSLDAPYDDDDEPLDAEWGGVDLELLIEITYVRARTSGTLRSPRHRGAIRQRDL